jgi:hypothetical protein
MNPTGITAQGDDGQARRFDLVGGMQPWLTDVRDDLGLAILSHLNTVVTPKQYSPADGDPDRFFLEEAAKFLKSTVGLQVLKVDVPPKKPAPPGAVY